MKIERVEYRQLKSTGNFENETYGATAIVEEGEVAGVVMERLKEFIDEFFEDSARKRDAEYGLENSVARKRQELEHLNESIQSAREKWEQARCFLEKHGIPADRYEPLPF